MSKAQLESPVIALADHPTTRANAVKAQYQATEAKFDEAIGSALVMVQELMAFQKDLGISATSGEYAISPAMKAVDALRQARAELVASHKFADRVAKAAGIRPSMTGWSKPQVMIAKEEDRAVS